MWPFRKKGEIESKIEKLDTTLEISFQRVKQDMDSVNSWIHYLYSQGLERQKLIEIIHSQMSQLSTMRPGAPDSAGIDRMHARMRHVEEKIELLGVSVKSVEPMIDRVAQLNSQVMFVEESQKTAFDKLRALSEKVENTLQIRTRTAHNLREKIVKKVARRSKEYIKNLLLSTITRYEQISAMQLREMIVEEQGLCSKSTFYRILEEIENEGSISMLSQGKEKLYLPKLMKKH